MTDFPNDPEVLEAHVAAGGSLAGADLSGRNLEDVRLPGAQLAGADLRSAVLRGADLRGADLSRALLDGALFDDARLEGAVLRGVRAEGCAGRGARLNRADLREARITYGSLAGADLRGANLQGAVFAGTDLRGTGLRPEQIAQADFAGAHVDVAGPDAQTVPHSRSTTHFLNGLPHRVHRWAGADEAAAPLLALHGFTGGGEDFACLSAHLSRTLIAPDLLGHGHSDAPRTEDPYTVEAQVARLAELHTQLELPPVPVLGYSMGGRIALRFALEHPSKVAGLVLVGVHPGLVDEEAREGRYALDTDRADYLMTYGVAAFLAEWQALPLIASQSRIFPALLEDMQVRRSRARSWGWAWTLRGMSPGRTLPLWDRLNEIACPVLLITGAEDEVYSELAQGLVEVFAEASHVSIEGVGHAAHLEGGGLAGPLIASFLARF